MENSIESLPLIPTVLSIAIAYLIGSISSTYIVGRLAGNVDMRREPDGRVSASAVYSRLGPVPFLIVIIMDASLAAAAVIIARMLTMSPLVMMFSGFSAVAGHNWSIFQRLKGGLGATAMLGSLVTVMPWQLLYGLLIGGFVFVTTRRPGLSTAFVIFGISSITFLQYGFGLLGIYPLMLYLLMLLKKYQVARLANPAR